MKSTGKEKGERELNCTLDAPRTSTLICSHRRAAAAAVQWERNSL